MSFFEEFWSKKKAEGIEIPEDQKDQFLMEF